MLTKYLSFICVWQLLMGSYSCISQGPISIPNRCINDSETYSKMILDNHELLGLSCVINVFEGDLNIYLSNWRWINVLGCNINWCSHVLQIGHFFHNRPGAYHGLILIPLWISNCIQFKVTTVDVWKWISNSSHILLVCAHLSTKAPFPNID